MTVLVILGLAIGAYLLYFSAVKFNEYTQKQYRYLFFQMNSFLAIAISYGLLFFGNRWYETALDKGEDTLNGIILMVIGVIIIIAMIIKNFYETDFITGLFGTLFQLSLYVLCTIIGAFVLLVLFAIAAQTRPVYNLNSN